MTDATGTAAYLLLMAETLEAQGVPFDEAVVQAITDARADPEAPPADQPAVMAFGTLAMKEWYRRGARGDDYARLLDKIGAQVLTHWTRS